MSMIGAVFHELAGMFFADARLTLAILALITSVGGLIVFLQIEPLVGGGMLLLGCLAILLEAVCREARRKA